MFVVQQSSEVPTWSRRGGISRRAVLAAAVLAVLALPLHAQARPRRAAPRVSAATLASFDTNLTSVPQSSIPFLDVLFERLGRRIVQEKDQYETTETWRRRLLDSARTVEDSVYAGWLRPGHSSPQLSYDPDREVYTVTPDNDNCSRLALFTVANYYHFEFRPRTQESCRIRQFEIQMPRARAQELSGHWRFLLVIARPHGDAWLDYGVVLRAEGQADPLALWAIDDRDWQVIAKMNLLQVAQ